MLKSFFFFLLDKVMKFMQIIVYHVEVYTREIFFIIKSFWFFLQWNLIHNYWLFYLVKQPPHFTYPLIKSTKLFRKANSVGIKFMTDSNWTDIKQMKKLINQSKKYMKYLRKSWRSFLCFFFFATSLHFLFKTNQKKPLKCLHFVFFCKIFKLN